mmetsp:Transcript_41644/g.109939  ORF Transcript_41644/g.109939 Transcript_41644/m.109939 type:complete len:228 (-) Transcript_41644:975-1658(-)
MPQEDAGAHHRGGPAEGHRAHARASGCRHLQGPEWQGRGPLPLAGPLREQPGEVQGEPLPVHAADGQARREVLPHLRHGPAGRARHGLPRHRRRRRPRGRPHPAGPADPEAEARLDPVPRQDGAAGPAGPVDGRAEPPGLRRGRRQVRAAPGRVERRGDGPRLGRRGGLQEDRRGPRRVPPGAPPERALRADREASPADKAGELRRHGPALQRLHHDVHQGDRRACG